MDRFSSSPSFSLSREGELGRIGTRLPVFGRSVGELLSRTLAFAEYCVVYFWGVAFGISGVIRYLRNPNPRITVKLLRAFGATIGSRTTIKRSLILDNVYEDQDSVGDFARLRIGQNCYVGDCVFFDLANEIIIEDDAVIAGRASFVTHSDCNRSVYLSEKFPRKTGPIVVGSGAWIGFGATVLHGVAVGNNSVIASNALLLEDTEPRSVFAGIPARKLRRIE